MSRTDKSDGHIVITGTGRSGTTFLVQLFTLLGFDTGFTRKGALNQVSPVSRSGLEFGPQKAKDWPYVVKSPRLTIELDRLVRVEGIKVKAVIVPMRDMDAAVASRMRVTNAGESRGGLWRASTAQEQAYTLLEASHRIFCTIAAHRMRHFLPHFPTLVQEPDHLFEVMRPLLEEHGVDRGEFDTAFARAAQPSFVTDFEEQAKPEGVAP